MGSLPNRAPRSALALAGAALILAGLGPPARAAESARICVERAGAPASLIRHCTAAIQAGRLQGGDLARLYNGRGVAYHLQGAPDQAVADYGAAIRLDPHFADAYANRGNAYQLARELDRAIIDYDTAIWLKPGFAEAYFNRGKVFIAKGYWTRAVADFDHFLRARTDLAGPYYYRGVAYQAMGMRHLALEDFRKAYALSPDDPTIGQKIRELGLAE